MTTTTTATPAPEATGMGTGGGNGSASSSAAPDPRAQGGLDLATVSAALKLLHGDIKGSVIELRIIPPRRGGNTLDGYFEDIKYLLLEVRAYDGRQQIYAGIHPRPARLLSRAKNHLARAEGAKQMDIEDVTAFVVDIDPVRPKGEAATDAELALAMRVAEQIRNDFIAMGWPGPIRVMSGNGTHIVFCFPPVHIRDDAHRAEVAAMLRAFESFIQTKYTVDGVGIDTISDLPRILKLAGTMSVKGENTPERPWRRSYFIDPPVRVENPLFWTFVESLPKVEEKKTKSTTTKSVDAADIVIGDKPSARVMQAVMANKNTRAHWEGRGKPAMNADGTPGDCTGSGYHWTLLLDLIKAGIIDINELATAIAHQPVGNALAKGIDYIRRTVQRALAVAAPQAGKKTEGNFAVHGAMITSSVPKIFTLVTSLGELEINAADLAVAKRFDTVFLDRFGKLPVLGDDDADRPWADTVNDWLSGALVVELAPEASTAFRLNEAIYSAVLALTPGVDVADLDRRRFVPVNGRKAFKSKTIAEIVNRSDPSRTPVPLHKICAALEQMGCRDISPYVGRRRVRLYLEPDGWPANVTGATSSMAPHGDPRQLCFFFVDGVEQVHA